MTHPQPKTTIWSFFSNCKVLYSVNSLFQSQTSTQLQTLSIPTNKNDFHHTVISTTLFVRKCHDHIIGEKEVVNLEIFFLSIKKPYFEDYSVLMDSKTGSCLWDIKLKMTSLFWMVPAFPKELKLIAFMGGELQENKFTIYRYSLKTHVKHIIYPS